MSVNRNQPLFLSDGTPVSFVKVTSKGNYQVLLPSTHPFADGQENGRIFRPRTGKHYKAETELTLTNTAPAVAASVDHTQPMFLNDGTPVVFSKLTRRGRIQVRLPDSHPAAAGQENGWLFEAATGGRYKGRDPSITLTNTAPASGTVAPATSANVEYALSVGDSIVQDGFTSLDDAEKAGFGSLDHETRSINVLKITTEVVAVIGVNSTRA